MMMTSRVSMFPLRRCGRDSESAPPSGVALDPAEPPGDQEDSAEQAPRRPDVAVRRDRQEAEEPDRCERERGDDDEDGEQAVDDRAYDAVDGLDRAFTDEA